MLPYLQDEDILKADLTALKMFLQQAYPVVRAFAEPFKTALETRRRFSSYQYIFPMLIDLQNLATRCFGLSQAFAEALRTFKYSCVPYDT